MPVRARLSSNRTTPGVALGFSTTPTNWPMTAATLALRRRPLPLDGAGPSVVCAVVVIRRILGSARNPAQFVVGAFVVVILIGAVLLRLPISADEGSLSWHDSLFWSTSATTITGLVTVDISTFSLFGEL